MMLKNKIICCALLLAAVMIAALLFCGCAEEKEPETALMPQQEAENWVKTNYEDFYDIRNLESTLLSEDEVDGELQYTVAIQCEMKNKFESVEDIPFVKGIRDEIKDMELSETQRSTIEDYISSGIQFDSVIASEDMFAIAFQKAMGANNGSVPIISFNNSILSSCATPRLTSIDLMLDTMCSTTISMLYDLLRGKRIPNRVVIAPVIVERDTFKPKYHQNSR